MRIDSLLSAQSSESVFLRYALAIAATSTLLLTCSALNPFVSARVMFVLLFPAIAFSAWYCGVGPSIVAVVLALVGARYWFITPTHSFRVPDTAQLICMLVFLSACSIVVAMGEARRRDNEHLRRAQEELEDRVQERTVELDGANKSLRQLSARLLQLQDEERRRIARELHDSVGQLLVGLTMNLSAVRTDIERLTKTARALTDSETMVQEMTKEVRTISHLLHPPLLDEVGLSSAIRWYIDGFAQRSNIKVDLDFPKDFGRLPREVETAIFRVVQECLTNIHRHSRSSTARIRFRHRDGQVLIEIEDKGTGISEEKRDELVSAGMPGVGIMGMRERLAQLGGALEVTSNGNGTIISARLPVIESPSSANTFSLSSTSSSPAA